MTSNFIINDKNSYEPVSIVKGYYMGNNKRIVYVKLINGKVICLPKKTIQTEFIKDKDILQELRIDDWILRKFGLIK